jgi:hypothetical protein
MTLIKFLLNAVTVIAALITIVGNAWILFGKFPFPAERASFHLSRSLSWW